MTRNKMYNWKRIVIPFLILVISFGIGFLIGKLVMIIRWRYADISFVSVSSLRYPYTV